MHTRSNITKRAQSYLKESTKSSKGSGRTGSYKSSKSAKSSRRMEEEVEELRPADDRFQKDRHFHSYCLVNWSTQYREQVAKHLAKVFSRHQIHMMSQLFESPEQESFIGFVHAFLMACDKSEPRKEAPMWLFLFSIKTAASPALTACIFLKSRLGLRTVKEGLLTLYVQAVNHLLENFAKENITAEGDMEDVGFPQVRNV